MSVQPYVTLYLLSDTFYRWIANGNLSMYLEESVDMNAFERMRCRNKSVWASWWIYIFFAEQRFNKERQKLCCSFTMSNFCLSLHGKGFRPLLQYFLDISSTNNSKEEIYSFAGDRNLAWQNLSVVSLVLFHYFLLSSSSSPTWQYE